MSSKKRRGSKPSRSSSATLVQPALKEQGGFPVLSLRHLQNGFGVEDMSPDQCKEFLVKWAKRSTFSWKELSNHGRHGLGSEKLPRSAFRPSVPEQLAEDKYTVFRHKDNLPFAGIKAGDVFHVLWIECAYGDLYKHG